MKIIINNIPENITDLLQEFGKIIDFDDRSDKKDQLVKISRKYGSGSIWYREVTNGMGLLIVKNLKLHLPLEIEYNPNGKFTAYTLNFIKKFGGNIKLNFEKNQYEINKGAYIACSHLKETDTFRPLKTSEYISIVIFPEFIERYLENRIRNLSGHANHTEHFYHIPQLSPEMNIALNSLENIDFTGKLKDIFLESKVLELIALFFDNLDNTANQNSISPRDKELILKAKEILDKNIENPPLINVLSKQIGINEQKLQNGFKQLFNTTIFGYVRKQRMIIAKKLIEKDGFSVSEAGYQVGYSNISHFTRAFKNEFGILPSRLKKN